MVGTTGTTRTRFGRVKLQVNMRNWAWDPAHSQAREEGLTRVLPIMYVRYPRSERNSLRGNVLKIALHDAT